MRRKILKTINFLSPEDILYIKKAIKLAKKAHENQFRKGGEKYISHPLRVALEVAKHFFIHDKSKLKTAVISAILHDVVEDTDNTLEEIEKLFGKEVGKIIFSLSHPKNPDGTVNDDELDEIYLPRIVSGGEIAIIIKRFDVLDNLSCLHQAPIDFQKKNIAGAKSRLSFWEANDPEGMTLIKKMIEKF